MNTQNVWFAGLLISDRGGSMAYNRLGTMAFGARLYPYGDAITSTANSQVTFGTYYRDGYSGLDYADNRYYASSLGRFTSVDPTMDNVDPSDPLSWNNYAYTEGDPVNYNDPFGLAKCSDWYDAYNGKSFGSEILAQNDQALLGRVDWAESDGGQFNGFQTQAYFDEKAAVAVSIVNRMDILNYKILISDGNQGYVNPGTLGWGPVGASLTQVLNQSGQYASVSGGNIDAAFQKKLTSVLGEDATSQDCVSLVNSYQAGTYALAHVLADPFASKGVTTSFHHGSATGSLEPYFGTLGSPNNFFGIPTSRAVFNPEGTRPSPSAPGRSPGRGGPTPPRRTHGQ